MKTTIHYDSVCVCVRACDVNHGDRETSMGKWIDKTFINKTSLTLDKYKSNMGCDMCIMDQYVYISRRWEMYAINLFP